MDYHLQNMISVSQEQKNKENIGLKNKTKINEGQK
jgi:hypothetical protein